MANISFIFVGKIKAIRENDKFQPYAETSYESGYVRRQLLFNAFDRDNRHTMGITGGHFPAKPDDAVLTFSQGGMDADGNRIKGDKLTIPWKDRNLPANIEKVADFRKYTVDLNENGRLRALRVFAGKIREGESLTDEELRSVGLSDESEVSAALEKAEKLRREFISEWDFAEFMHKVLESGRFDDKLFFIRGIIEQQWSDQKEQWYTTMRPQRVYLARSDEQECCEGSAVLFFTDDAVDESTVEESGVYTVTAYTFEYDSARKKNIPCPFKLTIPKSIPRQDGVNDGKDENRAKAFAKKFVVTDGSVKEYGVRFDILDGAQKIEITEDMLTDEQREDLDLGLITMDEIRAELGGKVYGERVVENRYLGVARGYTKGRKDTGYDIDALKIPPLYMETKKPVNLDLDADDALSEDEEDLFN